ncbi:hypothetical protein WDW86_10100 [Bdellovibrionota bacterium FG-2]
MHLQFRKLILTVLAVMPIASISLAATSELSAMEGEVQKGILLGDALKIKGQLFSDFETETTIDEAYVRFSKSSAIQDVNELNAKFDQALQTLLKNGLLQINEKNISSSVASGGGGWGQ